MFSPHRAFNPHSALVYTPIWLALPCFHYSQFLGTQKRWKRVTRMDSILSCVCLWKIFVFFSRLLVLQRFACDYCFSLFFFFLRKNTSQNVWIYRTAITSRYFMCLFLFLQHATKIIFYLHKFEHTATTIRFFFDISIMLETNW